MLVSAHAVVEPTPTWDRFSEPETVTGVSWAAVVVPLPSWPLPPAPQQYPAPALVSAHADDPPAEMLLKVSEPDTATGVFWAAVVVPLPSWPLPPAPQQYPAPALVSAHAVVEPTPTWDRFSEPDTVTGVSWAAVVVPLPSWPLPPAPQQYPAPALVSAHADDPPAERLLKVSEPDTATGTVLVVAVVPLPSWPLPPWPQQYAAPVLASAQVKSVPAAIWVKVSPDSTPPVYAATGTPLLMVEPFPSSP